MSCEEEPETPSMEEELSASCTAAASILTCVPAVTVDTSCVQMQMLLDSLPYQPIANWTCVITSVLGVEHIWVNGSILFGNKAVTLQIRSDANPGTYPLLHNTDFGGFYIPSFNADNFLIISGVLEIVEHDQANKFISGSFDFVAENLQSAVLPKVIAQEGSFAAHY